MGMIFGGGGRSASFWDDREVVVVVVIGGSGWDDDSTGTLDGGIDRVDTEGIVVSQCRFVSFTTIPVGRFFLWTLS